MKATARRRRRGAWTLLAVVLLAPAWGCACAIELSRAEISAVVARWPAAPVPRRTLATIQMLSVPFTGEFQGVLIQRPQPVAVRMQLFPDLGGKALDLAASATEQHGILPMMDTSHSYPDGPEDRLLGMFAATALEIASPLDAQRIQCCTRTGTADDVRLELAPRFGLSSCEVELRGTTRLYQLRRSGVRWTARVTAEGNLQITGRGFRMTCTVDESEDLEDVADAVFEAPR